MAATKEDLEEFLEKNKSDREPSLRTALITGAVAAIGALILYFFPNISEEHLKLIMALSALIVPIILGFAIRNRVMSPATVKRLMYLRTIAYAKEHARKTSATTVNLPVRDQTSGLEKLTRIRREENE